MEGSAQLEIHLKIIQVIWCSKAKSVSNYLGINISEVCQRQNRTLHLTTFPRQSSLWPPTTRKSCLLPLIHTHLNHLVISDALRTLVLRYCLGLLTWGLFGPSLTVCLPALRPEQVGCPHYRLNPSTTPAQKKKTITSTQLYIHINILY